jgi:GPH family glycoside/pentoside/hexuronide:cation symporter
MEEIPMTTTSPNKKLSFGRISLYSLASAGLNILAITIGTWMIYFYAPPPDSGRVQYLPAALLGVVGFLVGIWDAVIDPFIGHFSDNLRSRWGRRRPFLIFAAPVTAILAVLIWTPPQNAGVPLTLAYFLFIVLAYNTAYSLVGIPYDASMPEMAPEAKERVKLSYWKNVFGIIGVLIGSLVAAPLFGTIGPVYMGVVIGAVALLTIYGTLLGLKETPKPVGEQMSVIEGLKATLKNKQFQFVFFSTLLVHITYAMIQANLPYFVTLVVGGTEGDVGIYLGIIIVIMAVSGPLWLLWNKKLPQRQLLQISMIGLAICLALFYLVGNVPGIPVDIHALVMLGLTGIFLGGYLIIIYAMMGNLVDYDEMLTGRRREANYYGTFSLGVGLGSSAGILVLPLLLEWLGYTKANPLGVRVAFLVMTLFVVVGYFLFRGYKLGETPEETREIMNIPEK